MKIKMEYVVLAALIVALSSYLVLRKTDRSLYELPIMDSVNAADISKIDISRAGKFLKLIKKGDNWVIGEKGYPADSDKVKGLVDGLAEFSVTALISESKNYPRYDLDADNRIGVKSWIGDRLCRDVYLGKTASSYRHTFVMVADDPRVYQTGGDLRSRFDLQLDDLRDKVVLTIQFDKISRIILTRKDKTAVLIREIDAVNPGAAQTDGDTTGAADKTDLKNGGWKNSNGGIVDKEAIDTLLSSLKDLRCDRFIEAPKEAFSSPAYTVTLEGDKRHVIKIYDKSDKEDKEFPAVSSQNDYPFILSKWAADRIMKDPDSLMQKEQ